MGWFQAVDLSRSYTHPPWLPRSNKAEITWAKARFGLEQAGAAISSGDGAHSD
jgi:hypothetical protein